jgi:hypothetical protein
MRKEEGLLTVDNFPEGHNLTAKKRRQLLQ